MIWGRQASNASVELLYVYADDIDVRAFALLHSLLLSLNGFPVNRI